MNGALVEIFFLMPGKFFFSVANSNWSEEKSERVYFMVTLKENDRTDIQTISCCCLHSHWNTLSFSHATVNHHYPSIISFDIVACGFAFWAYYKKVINKSKTPFVDKKAVSGCHQLWPNLLSVCTAEHLLCLPSSFRRYSLGSSRNPPPPRTEEDCVTSPKSVCAGGHVYSRFTPDFIETFTLLRERPGELGPQVARITTYIGYLS